MKRNKRVKCDLNYNNHLPFNYDDWIGLIPKAKHMALLSRHCCTPVLYWLFKINELIFFSFLLLLITTDRKKVTNGMQFKWNNFCVTFCRDCNYIFSHRGRNDFSGLRLVLLKQILGHWRQIESQSKLPVSFIGSHNCISHQLF